MKNFSFNNGKKFSPTEIFYNNKFALAFSVVLSFVMWAVISANDTEGRPVTVSDIPINLSLPESALQDGLRIFSGQNIKAQIDITGNRLIVGQISKNDIQVVATQSINAITSPGNYTLELTAKKAGIRSDYEFASAVKPAFITVMVDRYREAEFTIETDVKFSANPEYFVGSVVLSQPKVLLSGPETEISRIKKVIIKGDISDELTSTYNFKAPILLYDAYGDIISSETIAYSASEADVTIPVLMRKKVPIKANFINKPKDLNVDNMVKITPADFEIAGPKDIISDVEKIELPTVNFNEIGAKNTEFDLQVNMPQGCRSLDSNYTIKLELNFPKLKERIFRVANFDFINSPEGKNSSVYNEGIDVKIIGPSYKASSIKASDLIAQIDLKNDKNLQGHMELPVAINIQGCNEIWVYGEYSVNVVIK
jgi:YbbR domain-containing protein